MYPQVVLFPMNIRLNVILVLKKHQSP